MIRKSIAGLVIAVVVILGSGTWFSGMKTQTTVEHIINGFNKANKNSNSTHDMTLSYKNYKRGFFSSSFQIALTFNNGITESEIKSGQSIVLNINVDHGPFPLSQLSKGNIKPTIATAKVSLAKNEVTQSYYTATKGKTPFAADIVVAFGGALTTEVNITPAKFQDISYEDGKFMFRGDDSSPSNMAVTGYLNNVIVNLDSITKLTANSMTVNALSHMEEMRYPVGISDLKFNKVRLQVLDNDIAKINTFTAKTILERTKDKKYINANFSYAIDTLKKGDQNFGSGDMSLQFNDIDPNAFRAFIEYNNTSLRNQLANNPDLIKDENAMDELRVGVLGESLPILLKSEPVIQIPVKWKNTVGELKGHLNIATDDARSVDNSIKSLDLNIFLPFNVIGELEKQINLSEGKNTETAQRMAEQALAEFKDTGQQLDLFKFNDNTASLQLHYEQGKVNFNGNEMTDMAFFMRMARLMP
ncbi:TPA: DUF945 family protein [Escherichia albertii]|uniref:DUF945 family protein n=1 Tax=Escherichia albertii TaxID=208962 RepID=UPI000743E409|nr:DUF945 family protein [Escherichia albertii]EFC7611939.1 DUF945 family protein [Escherichia albertii]EHK6581068.1 DUF945 family protein [Escherichia albertii]EHW5858249.1 DUF945 family protein [Escherichia albertii]MCU7301571.1 DUF945 family protein [Escherichia albertii]MCV3220173.1 DUF945 family protein [Escherichia albertii]